jgi:hypothetical protein
MAFPCYPNDVRPSAPAPPATPPGPDYLASGEPEGITEALPPEHLATPVIS